MPAALRASSRRALADAFQVSDTNPLVGVEGRIGLVRALGRRADHARRDLSGRASRLACSITCSGSPPSGSAPGGSYSLHGIPTQIEAPRDPRRTARRSRSDLARPHRARRHQPRRRVAASSRRRHRLVGRPRAVSQALAVARVLAVRAAAARGSHDHAAGRTDRSARVPQRRPARRSRRARAEARCAFSAKSHARRGSHRRVARAHRRAARSRRRERARDASASHPRSCRSRTSSRAGRGPLVVPSLRVSAPAAARRSGSRPTEPYSEQREARLTLRQQCDGRGCVHSSLTARTSSTG